MTEQASLMNVEELLTDFNWKASGNAAALEKRLLGELHALEAVGRLYEGYKSRKKITHIVYYRLMYMLLSNRMNVFGRLLIILTSH